MRTASDSVKDALVAKGIRATKHRLAVAKILAASNLPMGIKDIYSAILSKNVHTGIATIYRVVSALESAGIVNRLPSVNGEPARYQVVSEKSGKVMCSRCGKYEDIDQIPGLRDFREIVAKHSKFASTYQSLYIIADCRFDEKCD